jgi:hypothetical protein
MNEIAEALNWLQATISDILQWLQLRESGQRRNRRGYISRLSGAAGRPAQYFDLSNLLRVL